MSDSENYFKAAELQATIKEMVAKEVEELRKARRYGTVVAIDGANRKCQVQFNGDVTATTVPFGNLQPSAVNQIVCIEGNAPDQYISDILGSSQADLNSIAINNRLSSLAGEVNWIQPTLGSGFSHVSGNPVQYRLVNDRGSLKMQLRGAFNISSSSVTTIWTMPVGYRRAVYTSVIISRNVSGGSNTAVLGINASGVMFLDGKTTGADSGVTTIGGSTAAAVTRSTTQPTTAPNNTGYAATSAVSRGSPGAGDHIHNFDHLHNVTIGGLSHQHDVPSPAAPTSISLDGVEYFM